jgi:hypothetical protein
VRLWTSTLRPALISRSAAKFYGPWRIYLFVFIGRASTISKFAPACQKLQQILHRGSPFLEGHDKVNTKANLTLLMDSRMYIWLKIKRGMLKVKAAFTY